MYLRFSSENVPAEIRKDVIAATFGMHVEGTVDFPAGHSARIELGLRGLDSVHIASIDTAPIHLQTKHHGNSELVYLGITIAGGGLIAAGREDREVRAGDINVMRCGNTIVGEPSRILSVAIPHARISPRLTSADALYRNPIRPSASSSLLQNYVGALAEFRGTISRPEQASFAAHIVDLAVLTLGAGRDEGEIAKRRGLRAARWQAVRADIAAHLAAPGLSIAWLSRRHNISESSIRALFYDEGTSFTDYVLGARLDHAASLLVSPYLREHTIASLALMSGFGDLSWFNQAFRRRFGRTPSDIRRGGGRSAAGRPTALADRR